MSEGPSFWYPDVFVNASPGRSVKRRMGHVFGMGMIGFKSFYGRFMGFWEGVYVPGKMRG